MKTNETDRPPWICVKRTIFATRYIMIYYYIALCKM